MPTRIHVSERWEPFIRSELASGRYGSEDEVVEEALSLLLRRSENKEAATSPASSSIEPKPSWMRVLENMQDLSDELFEEIPTDSSEQLDHYLYGTPKRPSQ